MLGGQEKALRELLGLHRQEYRNAIKGALLPRFAHMSLINLTIVGTLNHRIPVSSPGAPAKLFKHLAAV
jgi:hypothetical protein